MSLLLTALAATVGGITAQRLSVPGGPIFGAMVGAAAVTLLRDVETTVPGPLKTAALIVIGMVIGAQITRSAMSSVAAVLLPAVLSALLIIAAGLAITLLLRMLGQAPPQDVLATSPGALSVVAGVAVERGAGAVEVAVFHLVRVVLVILSLPLVLSWFLRSPS